MEEGEENQVSVLSVVVDVENQEPEAAAAKETAGTPSPIDVGESQKVAFKHQDAEENPTDGPELEVNQMFLQFYCFVLGLGVWQTSMSFVGMTQTIPLVAEKFGWGDEIKFYNTIITSSGIFGLSMGSLLGGKTITIGRRKAGIIC